LNKQEVSQHLEAQPHGGALLRSVAQAHEIDIEAVQGLREYNAKATKLNPAKIAWEATLPLELALKTASPQELKAHYGYDDEEWDALRDNPVFIAELAKAIELVKQDGMSFKLKCQLQGEAMLDTSWRLIHAPASEVPAAVKARLMETTWRMAGYDSKDVAAAGGGNSLAIQINFSGSGQPQISAG
jgi:hypothetical protein